MMVDESLTIFVIILTTLTRHFFFCEKNQTLAKHRVRYNRGKIKATKSKFQTTLGSSYPAESTTKLFFYV